MANRKRNWWTSQDWSNKIWYNMGWWVVWLRSSFSNHRSSYTFSIQLLHFIILCISKMVKTPLLCESSLVNMSEKVRYHTRFIMHEIVIEAHYCSETFIRDQSNQFFGSSYVARAQRSLRQDIIELYILWDIAKWDLLPNSVVLQSWVTPNSTCIYIGWSPSKSLPWSGG